MTESTAPAELSTLPALDAIDTKLNEPQEIETEMTYEVPNILLDAKAAGGIATHSIRESRPVQVPLTTRIEWAGKPEDEHANVFTIKARNLIRFGGNKISVINDATEYGDVKLPATSPTASEYLKFIGQPVMIHFDCTRDLMETQRLGRPVFKIVRNSILLP